jgi:flagellar biogenesis protein FliO
MKKRDVSSVAGAAVDKRPIAEEEEPESAIDEAALPGAKAAREEVSAGTFGFLIFGLPIILVLAFVLLRRLM